MSHRSIRKAASLCLVAGTALGVSAQANEPTAQDPLDRKVQELREESRGVSRAARQAAIDARADGGERQEGARGPAESAAVQVLREESREVSRAAHQAAVRARDDGTPGMAVPDGARPAQDGPKVLGGPAAAGPAERAR